MLFSNNENEIKTKLFEILVKKNETKFCFVNNASKDKTLEKLKEIKIKTLNNVSIIDIKKDKGIKVAIKAGVRYLINNNDFKSIIYFEFSNYKNLEILIENVFNKKNFKTLIKNINERKTLKNVFSLDQLIKK